MPREARADSKHFKPGTVLGRLTLLEFIPCNGAVNQRASWKSRCECGREKIIDEGSLKRKTHPTRTCGSMKCKNTQATRLFPKEHAAWKNMKTRCYNPNTDYYSYYGGRGIKVCDEWRDDFWMFLHDMGPRPEGDYSLDRIDNDGDYKPSNCRWTDRSTQQQNSRKCL